MTLKERLRDLLNKQKAILDTAKAENRGLTADENTNFTALQTEIDSVSATIKAEEQFAATNAAVNVPAPAAQAPVVQVVNNPKARPFKNFAEQLRCIKDHAITGSVDERLVQVQNANGATAGAGKDGGFAIQEDFAGNMFESAIKEDPILSLVDTYQVSSGADRVSWNDLAETSIASTVWGGIQTYWAAEAATVASSKPLIQERELKLEKLMGFYYNSGELEADSAFNSAVVSRGFTASIRRNLAAAIIGGDGIGKPIGLLNAASLVSVAKETGQVAATVVWENITKMYHRALGDQSKFVWLAHPDVQEQLAFMKMPIGTGGVPVYQPASLLGPIATMYSRPVMTSDLCSTLGSKGDVYFVDPSQYLMIYKGGIDQAISIHVAFLTAENCFRFIFRVNGMPKRNSALTIKNSAKTRSSIVTLDARS